MRIESGLRATAAHSTLVLDDVNSTAVLINGKLGTGVTEVELDRRMLSGDKADRAHGSKRAMTAMSSATAWSTAGS